MTIRFDRWHRSIDGKPVARLSATWYIDAEQTTTLLALAATYLGYTTWLEKVGRVEATKRLREHLRRRGMDSIYNAFDGWDEQEAELLLTAAQKTYARLWGK